MASVFGVQYIKGGSSNFTVESLSFRSSKKEDLTRHVNDLRAMGYPAIIYNVAIGGFCDRLDFDTQEERSAYLEEVKARFL